MPLWARCLAWLSLAAWPFALGWAVWRWLDDSIRQATDLAWDRLDGWGLLLNGPSPD